jgi:lactoylglutathione lyase
MIETLDTVCIFVKDQDRAKGFYTGVLGFKLVRDDPLYPGAPNRWLAVVPPGGGTQVILYLMDDNWQHYRQTIGQSQAMTFKVSAIDALYAELSAKGVNFVEKPRREPWGTFATLEDSEGNRLLLVENPGGVGQ